MTNKQPSGPGAVSLIGVASVLNILIGLIKTKVAAMLLGPAGVGIIGLFQQLLGTASTVFELGYRTSGTRQVADASATRSAAEQAQVRAALFWGTVVLAAGGTVTFFLLRGLFASQVFGEPERTSQLGWLALGVGLSVGASSQQALLNGLRKIRELALLTVLNALLAMLVAVTALLVWNEAGIVIFVLASPAASFVLGHWFAARLPRPQTAAWAFADLWRESRPLIRLGVSVMLAATVVSAGHLIVRAWLQRELGAEALGLFTAAWLISQYYIGFLYQALTIDYYPRLTAAIGDRELANNIVNEQIRIALMFSAPMFLGMMALAPYVLGVLYTEEFKPAARTLQLFILGDILKVVAHPLSYVLLAGSAGRSYLLLRIISTSIFLVLTVILSSYIGLLGAGLAYFIMYIVLLPMVFWFSSRVIPIIPSRAELGMIGGLFALVALIFLIALKYPVMSAAAGSVAAICVGVYSFTLLVKMESGEKLLKKVAAINIFRRK